MKNPFSNTNVLIISPVIMVILLDVIFTLVGQPKSYWQNYTLFNEGSPLGQILMLSPIYFISFMIVYIVLISILIVNLKRPFNIMIGIGFFLGHFWGSSTWLYIIIKKLTGIYIMNDWYLVVGYIIVISIISGFCINKWFKSKLT